MKKTVFFVIFISTLLISPIFVFAQEPRSPTFFTNIMNFILGIFASITATPTQTPTSLEQWVSPSSPITYGTTTYFYCNYYVTATGYGIQGAACYVNIDGTNHVASAVAGAEGTWYRYQTSTLSVGTHSWYCSCSKSGYQSQIGSTQSYVVNPALTTTSTSTSTTTLPTGGCCQFRDSTCEIYPSKSVCQADGGYWYGNTYECCAEYGRCRIKGMCPSGPTTTTTSTSSTTTTLVSPCPYYCLASSMCSAEGGSCEGGYYCKSGCCCYIPGEFTTTTSTTTTTTTTQPGFEIGPFYNTKPCPSYGGSITVYHLNGLPYYRNYFVDGTAVPGGLVGNGTQICLKVGSHTLTTDYFKPFAFTTVAGQNLNIYLVYPYDTITTVLPHPGIATTTTSTTTSSSTTSTTSSTTTTTIPFTCSGELSIECSATTPIKATVSIKSCANYIWNVRVSAPTILGLPLLDYCYGDISTQTHTASCQTNYPASQYPEGNQLTTYKLYVYPMGTPGEKIIQVWREIASKTIKCVSVETTTTTTSTTTTTKPPIPTSLSQWASPTTPTTYGTTSYFFCEYTAEDPVTKGELIYIQGATCYVNIDGTNHGTTAVAGPEGTWYRYQTSTLSVGTHSWYCSCSKSGYQSQTGSTQSYVTNPAPTTTSTSSTTTTLVSPCPYYCLASSMCSAEGGICRSGYYCKSGCCCYIPGEVTTTTTQPLPPTTTTIPCNPDECNDYCLNRNRPGGYCTASGCVCRSATGPVPAGIFENLWEFIKAILGIK